MHSRMLSLNFMTSRHLQFSVYSNQSLHFLYLHINTVQNHLPYRITYPTESPTVQSHLPYRITYSPESTIIQNHLPYRINYRTESPTVQNHLPSRITYNTESPSVQSHLTYRITYRTESPTVLAYLAAVLAMPLKTLQCGIVSWLVVPTAQCR